MKTGAIFLGSQRDCKTFLKDRKGFYVYVLRRPDGRPFYVGKGIGDRVFAHENEARHPNDFRSNAHKLNVIRAILRAGHSIRYEIDFVTDDEVAAYAREVELIGLFRRLHEGGTLTNLAPGGGSTAGLAPASKARHQATLGGVPEDNPERATLNGFVLSISEMQSVVLKPLRQFRARPTQPYPGRSMGPSRRQAVALVASAAANGLSLDTLCSIPRRVVVEGVQGLIENGVACDIATSGMATVVPAENPMDEYFDLSSDQAKAVVSLVGVRKCVNLGVISPAGQLAALAGGLLETT